MYEYFVILKDLVCLKSWDRKVFAGTTVGSGPRVFGGKRPEGMKKETPGGT